MSLSEEQRKKIEENRLRALALRANKQPTVSNVSTANVLSSSKASSPFATSATTSNSSTGNQSKTNFFSATGIKPAAFTSTAGSQSKTNFFTAKEIKPGAAKEFSQKFSKDRDKKVQSVTASVSSGANAAQTKNQKDFSLGKDGVVAAKFVLLSRTRFAVDTKFFAPLIEMFKTMNTRQYGEFYWMFYCMESRIACRIAALVWQCLPGVVPVYL